MNGVIIIDKPAGWTSHDVVNRMRRILGQRSVGHLGTLDPLATGVLPLVTGSLTRLAQFYTTSEKTYEGVIRFGFATNTYDADGDPLEPAVGPACSDHVGTAAVGSPSGRSPDLDLDTLQQLAAKFHGLIEQTPPPFSAKKIHGVPAYKLARKQQEVILKPVQVEIKEFAILSVDGDRAHFRARVSSGTYMRSIAHEMGQLLGPGAHLESLRRTAVAEFDLTQAHTLEEIEGIKNNERIENSNNEQIEDIEKKEQTENKEEASLSRREREAQWRNLLSLTVPLKIKNPPLTLEQRALKPSSSIPASSCPNFPPSPPTTPPPPASAAAAPSTSPNSPAPARSKSSTDSASSSPLPPA